MWQFQQEFLSIQCVLEFLTFSIDLLKANWTAAGQCVYSTYNW